MPPDSLSADGREASPTGKASAEHFALFRRCPECLHVVLTPGAATCRGSLDYLHRATEMRRMKEDEI
jgi:hypothetical protein